MASHNAQEGDETRPDLDFSSETFTSVASGAGPRAVGTERGRWSNW